jgi:hypothetical protein
VTASTDDLCRRAIELLDDALGKPPQQLKAEVDEVERAVAALRDNLIERVRQSESPLAVDAPLRRALDRSNVALSLIVGIEYPVGGVQRGLINDARATLFSLCSDGLDAE